jgi:hypothetical protein
MGFIKRASEIKNKSETLHSDDSLLEKGVKLRATDNAYDRHGLVGGKVASEAKENVLDSMFDRKKRR